MPIITTQISQIQKGWSGSLTQKMKNLRSSPCEEHKDDDLLFSCRSILLCIRKEYYLKNSSQSSCDGVIGVSHNFEQSQ